MWQINLVSVLVVASSLCQGASMPDAPGLMKHRLGFLNKYYLSWNNLGSGLELLVSNTDPDVAAVSLTGSENVAIVLHGRKSRAHSEFGVTLRDALIRADSSMAVILVDWQFAAAFNYAQAAALVPSVASDLSDFISRLVAANKLNVNQLHLIGFDLGAHVVGIASRNLATKAIKITGLDPAGEGWDVWSERLRSTDAQFVEVIHTDGFGLASFGIGEAIGTLDFFPNGGTRQPRCVYGDNECYHNRAWELFRETVDTGGHLVGIKCTTMMQMHFDRCTGLPLVVMGTLQLIKPQKQKRGPQNVEYKISEEDVIRFIKLDTTTGLYRVNTGKSDTYAPA